MCGGVGLISTFIHYLWTELIGPPVHIGHKWTGDVELGLIPVVCGDHNGSGSICRTDFDDKGAREEGKLRKFFYAWLLLWSELLIFSISFFLFTELSSFVRRACLAARWSELFFFFQWQCWQFFFFSLFLLFAEPSSFVRGAWLLSGQGTSLPGICPRDSEKREKLKKRKETAEVEDKGKFRRRWKEGSGLESIGVVWDCFCVGLFLLRQTNFHW